MKTIEVDLEDLRYMDKRGGAEQILDALDRDGCKFLIALKTGIVLPEVEYEGATYHGRGQAHLVEHEFSWGPTLDESTFVRLDEVETITIIKE
jgi:hypothetical protein